MKAIPIRTLATALTLGAAAAVAWADGDLVRFPENYAEGTHYATVERGNIREELFTSQKAIDAARSGQPLPSGTVITMEDYRGGKLFRYVVMEKRVGWGTQYPPEVRNGEWEFQAFNADRMVNRNENVTRCMACHKSREGQDFVFTLDRMKVSN
ncbi:cytochrome P460 family protein [Microvirga massiliensis]|uniref:cytochrome P460 family protein n=1 Tax=Microvirga massiliensis TaxID=1033741 RepID=UPI00062BCD97|nr:cytochrome P460 family protein [Microvirga massiliensis]